jgi:hypothetical protein
MTDPRHISEDVTELSPFIERRRREAIADQRERLKVLSREDIQAAHNEAILENERRSLELIRRFEVPPVFDGEIPLHPPVQQWLSRYRAGGDEFWKIGPHSLCLSGAPGQGKTHTAWQVIKIMLRIGVTKIDFRKSTELLEELTRHGVDPGQTIKELNDRSAELLVLDDLGSEVLTPSKRERLDRILDRRHDYRLPILITTNVNPADFEERFGGRARSRIAGMCGTPTLLPAIDYRRSKSTAETVPVQEQLS